MPIHHKLVAAAVALTVGAAPAVALANGPGTTHGKSSSAPGHTRATTTASPATTAPSSNAKRYGKLCQGQSKQHVKGVRGTPFSTCVTDMAHMAKHPKANPARVCANESKRHIAGHKGTPYSQCVVAAAKLRGHQSSTSGS